MDLVGANMVEYGPYLDEIEQAIGREGHVHEINEERWATDMMSTLNRISVRVARDLSYDLVKPTWDFQTGGQATRGNAFHKDPHPRFLGLALALISWLWWQEPTHQNVNRDEMQRLIQDAMGQGDAQPVGRDSR